MALDEIGFEDQTDMVHLVDRMRIDAEIVHVQSGDIDIDNLVTPKNVAAKSPSVQIVMQPDTPAAAKAHMDNSEMSKEQSKDITATKSVSFKYETGPTAEMSKDTNTEHSHQSHDVTHASSNDTHTQHTMMEHSMDDSTTQSNEKSEGDTHRRKRRRKVSEFAIDKMAKYKRVGETIQKYSAMPDCV